MDDTNKPEHATSRPMEDFTALMRKQEEAIRGLKTQLSNHLKKEIANSTIQLEAHQGLQALIGDLQAPFHGWPVSPDFALQMVRLIRDENYDLIVEFGSGTSTLICLKALERFYPNRTSTREPSTQLITFEHLDEYHQKTNDLIKTCSNSDLAVLKLGTLEPWSDSTGEYKYYSGTELIRQSLSAIASSIERKLTILVVIDGPPGDTCKWARYPAIPILLDACNGINLSIDFLLDDLFRTDEKETAIAWEKHFQSLGLDYQRTDYKFEKGGMLLRIEDLAEIDTSLNHIEALARENRNKKPSLQPLIELMNYWQKSKPQNKPQAKRKEKQRKQLRT